MVAKSQSSSFASTAGTVDNDLLNRAVSALLKHHATTTSKSNQLLDDDLDVQVQFTLARIPGNASPKPIRIDVPHPLMKLNDVEHDDVALAEASVCLIVKEESKPAIQQMIDRFPNELSCIKKVLGLQSLRTKHKSFSQKRDLLARFDIFLADDRILPMLTRALGNKFFEKKKQPVPINICREEALPFAVLRCLKGTFMYLSAGTCLTVKAGNTSMPSTHLISNIAAICTQAPLKVPRKWANIKSISIKTTGSVALPIYNKTLEDLEEIKFMAEINTIAKTEKGRVGTDEKAEQEKKRKDLVDKSPLARALKKQKSVNAEQKGGDVVNDGLKTPKDKKGVKPKSSKKRKDEHTENIDEPVLKTPKEKEISRTESESLKSKSAKKSKQTEPANETPKSTKKKQSESSDETFIQSKKYTGSKPGYVFRKDKHGLGYYRDVLPVVDKAWLASLKNGSGKGGGRKSMSHTPKKRKGNGRRSY